METNGNVGKFAVSTTPTKGRNQFTRLHHCRYLRYLQKSSLSEKQLQNLMSNYWEWKRLFIKCYKSKIETNHKISIQHMRFLNLHVGEHWYSTIKLFGCPAEYSTQHWEALHQSVKRKEKKSNHLKPSHDISRMIIEQTTLQRAYGSIDVSLVLHPGCVLILPGFLLY